MKLILLALAALLAGPALAMAQTTENVDIIVTHGASCANGPTISTDNYTPTAGSTVHVTVTCGPGNATDYVQLATAFPFAEFGQFFYLNGATGGTFTFTIPSVSSDRPAQYQAFFAPNNSTRNFLAVDKPITVPRTVNPPAPTQGLPASEAADPFVPAHTITVCASGCDYAALGDATNAAFNAGWDNVLVKISAGDYQYPAHTFGFNLPPHLWVKGISSDGVTFPHLFGASTGAGQSMFFTHQYFAGNNPTNASLTLDNLELGPWDDQILGDGDATQWTLRNVYVRDSAQGFISGNTHHSVINFFNVVFARHGSGNGPQHDVYIGEGDNANVVTIKNSVFEQSIIGHAFKDRASALSASCSMFLVNQDAVYNGSETLDMSDGGAVTGTNILSSNGAGAGTAWGNNNSWDNMRYGAEGAIPGYTNTPTFTGSVFLGDDPGVARDFFTMYLGVRLDKAPITWSGNTFVYAGPSAQANWNNVGGVVWVDTTRAPGMASPSDILIDGSNHVYTNRAAAGLPPVGSYPKGWRDFLPMMPSACTDPIGLVKIPAR